MSPQSTAYAIMSCWSSSTVTSSRQVRRVRTRGTTTDTVLRLDRAESTPLFLMVRLTLGDDNRTRVVMVRFERDEDLVVASLEGMCAAGVGCDRESAVEDLQSRLAARFEYLSANRERLSSELLRELGAILALSA